MGTPLAAEASQTAETASTEAGAFPAAPEATAGDFLDSPVTPQVDIAPSSAADRTDAAAEPGRGAADADGSGAAPVVAGGSAEPAEVLPPPSDPGDDQHAEGEEVAAAAAEADLDDPDRLRAAVEAVLLVVDMPTPAMLLAQVLNKPVGDIEQALRQLRDQYDAQQRGIDLREVAGGWRLYTRAEFAAYVERFVLEGQQTRLTQAALETLAVIAYRQPITRSRVSAIRGVNVDAVMRTLLTRGLVEECGSDADTGGGLYRTTQLFLERLGISSLEELPSLAPLLPDTSQLDDVALST
jgi:segregation and condensation protein B